MQRQKIFRFGSPPGRWFKSLAAHLLFAVLLIVSGCQLTPHPVEAPIAPAQPQAVARATTATTNAGSPAARSEQQAQNYTAALKLSPPHATIGTTVQIQGSGYAPGAKVELVWYTTKGSYNVQGGTEFVGERFDQVSRVLTETNADQNGAITTSIKVPQDFGGEHDLRGRVAGKEISQAGLTIDPTFSLTPSEGPIGTLVELRIDGVDWRSNINTWHVLYDNAYLGFMSAVTTNGVAVARFRASGALGDHQISVWHNSFNSIPYLNFTQGPYKDVPTAYFTFHVTSDPGVIPPIVEDYSATDNPWPQTGAQTGTLSLSLDRGPVGKPFSIHGANLPANTALTLRWWTMIGNRVSASGFSPESRDLATVTTGSDGRFTKDLTIPDDLGGQHRLEVVNGDTVLATSGVVIEPSVVSISPTQLRAGDRVQIHLKGVGWTTYENTYAVTYDNSYIGYVCGFSTNGDVLFTFVATGSPGTHIIDLYPTIYKGQDAQPRIYSVPQLTYATDHPQRITPAIRLAIEISN